MKIFKDFFDLFYPKTCANCTTKLLQNEYVICTICRHDLPLTNFNSFTDNKVAKMFYGRVTIEKAYALLFFRKKGITQKLIHDLKYKGNEEIGILFGNWLGAFLAENNQFSNIDVIVPVPIHYKRRKKRGYNQVTKFGKRLSHHLKKPFIEGVLIRKDATKTQTFKSRFERFSNQETQFLLTNKTFFKNKHILIIDDVVTTGATLEACAIALFKTEKIKISILTIAYTE